MKGIHKKKYQETKEFIDTFIKKNKRFPINTEVMKRFNLKSTSVSALRIKNYKERLNCCPLCGK